MRRDLGKLTQEETTDLLRELIDLLPEEALLEVLREKLTREQIEDLAA